MPLPPRAQQRAQQTRADREQFNNTVTARDSLLKTALSMPALGDESMAGFASTLYENQQIDYEQFGTLMESYGKAGGNFAKGLPAAFLGTSADLTAMAAALGYNAIRMAQGDDFAWPEDFSDVPATSDFYGEMLGADVSDFAFIGGALAVTNPAKYTKFVNKTLQAAKALKGGRKAAVLKLENAKALDQEGLSREEIWQQTGWWKSKDKGWRFAVSDADAAINSEELGRLSRMRESFDPGWKQGEVRQVTLRLDQILTHDAMYEMYPEVGGILTTVPVRKVDGGFKLANRSSRAAWYSPSENKIQVNKTQKIRETLLHEAQHAIQKIEGFSQGTSLKAMTEDITNYQVTHVLLDVHNNPLDYQDIDHDGIEYMVKRMVGERKSDAKVKSLVQDIYEMAHGRAEFSDEYIKELKGIQEVSGRNALRWLNQVGAGEAIEEMSPEMVDMYASMAYYMHLGEAEARVVESLSKVSQRNLDRVSHDPHRLMYWLDESRYKKVDPDGIARVQPMDQAVAEEVTIVK